MHELPWYWAFRPYLDPPEKQRESALHAGYVRVVNKNEVDAVLAEMEKKLDLYKRGFKEDDRINAFLYAELRRQKYRRCLAMAKLCHWKMGVFIYKKEKSDFYWRWYKRWGALAKKYKEALP